MQLREAGFEPNKLQKAYDDDILIAKFIGLTRELVHFPVSAEIRLKTRGVHSSLQVTDQRIPDNRGLGYVADFAYIF
jgi:hypothetical protein